MAQRAPDAALGTSGSCFAVAGADTVVLEVSPMRRRAVIAVALVMSLAGCGTTQESGGAATTDEPVGGGGAPGSEVPSDNQAPDLRRGETGDWVVVLQSELNRHGHGLELDGVFGQVTEAALRDFQDAHGLDADGVVGPDTWAALATAPPAGATIPLDEPPTTTGASSTTPPAPELALDYITYGEQGLFGAADGVSTRLVQQPVEWAAVDDTGGILFTLWESGRQRYLPAGQQDPVDPPSEVRIRDPRVGGGMAVSVERSETIVRHDRLVFGSLNGGVIEVPHNPRPEMCQGWCSLDAVLSPDGSVLVVEELTLSPKDFGLASWEEYEALDPGEREDRLRGAIQESAWLRAFALATGEEIWSFERLSGMLVDSNAQFVVHDIGVPGHASLLPGSYGLYDILTGEQDEIVWMTDDVDRDADFMTIDLAPIG